MPTTSLDVLPTRRCLCAAPCIVVSSVVLLWSAISFAQETAAKTDNVADKSAAPTFSADVKVVNIFATVRDKHGKIISNLSASDFMLEEDGHPVTLHYFSRDTNLPLTLGLLVDTSLSQRTVLD